MLSVFSRSREDMPWFCATFLGCLQAEPWGLRGHGDTCRQVPGLVTLGFCRLLHILLQETRASQNDFVEEEQEAFVLSVNLLCLPRAGEEGVMARFPPPPGVGEGMAALVKTAFQLAGWTSQTTRSKALGLSLWPVQACVLGHLGQAACWWDFTVHAESQAHKGGISSSLPALEEGILYYICFSVSSKVFDALRATGMAAVGGDDTQSCACGLISLVSFKASALMWHSCCRHSCSSFHSSIPTPSS